MPIKSLYSLRAQHTHGPEWTSTSTLTQTQLTPRPALPHLQCAESVVQLVFQTNPIFKVNSPGSELSSPV